MPTPSLSRIIRGKKAKSAGDDFELRFKQAAMREGFDVEHLPLGAKMYGPNLLKRHPMPFDFILCKSGRAIFLDTKTTQGGTFSYSCVIPHQLESLLRKQWQGHGAGYVVYFREPNKVVFYSAIQLSAMKPRESLKPEDGIDMGSIFQMNVFVLMSV